MGGWLQALIGRLEDRIAAVTTIPRHRDEEPIYVHRIRPGDKDPNIHHDKANKEYSAVTLIGYLSDVEEGGHTM